VRHERETRRGHHMLAHLRTEAYPIYKERIYPPATTRPSPLPDLSYEGNLELIDEAKRRLSSALASPRHPEPQRR
jgi:hypothetical protein